MWERIHQLTDTLTALHWRELTGEGQALDLASAESYASLEDWAAIWYQGAGIVSERFGSLNIGGWLYCFAPTRDGAVFLGGFLLIYRTIHSPFGQVLKAIRENEARAISLGYDTDRYKLVAFTLSAALSGLAGGTKAIVFQLASLTDVHWTMSGEVVLMALVGGLGTVFGPVVGAAVIVSLQNYLAGLGHWVTIVQGLIFVACVLAFRRGIVGEIARLWGRPL